MIGNKENAHADNYEKFKGSNRILSDIFERVDSYLV